MYMTELQNKYVPGWNTYLSTKHHLARYYFFKWVSSRKSSVSLLFCLMKTSRPQFKLALRSIKNNEKTIVTI